VKLSNLLFVGAGYVLGSRAGRERYGQIVEVAHKAAERVTAPGTGSRPSMRLADYLGSASGDGPRSAT
jgi:hypothetical protein